MTDATPLASEQITQEDREAAAKLYEWFHALSSSRDAALKSAQFVRTGGGDGWNTVQLFARHRIAALSATPAPSDQDASQAQGEDYPLALLVATKKALFSGGAPDPELEDARQVLESMTALGLLPAPGATAQDGVDIATVTEIETRPIDWPFSDEQTPPYWRVTVGEYSTDFEYEQAARNFAGAINAATRAPTPTIPAGMVAARKAWQRVQQAHRVGDPHGFEHHAAALTAALAAAPKQAEQQGVEQ